jgi:signal transduction histidine kinase/CheY-like chemotaxis protein
LGWSKWRSNALMISPLTFTFTFTMTPLPRLTQHQCISVPKAGRLCEHTLATLPPQDGGPAYFEVCDLEQDDRFNKLDFVSGPPYFRYYLGVPLRTCRGINIGSLFVMDNKVRPCATLSERRFLGVMADNVVQHLELLKERRDRQRSTTMNMCLSAFVDRSGRRSPHSRSRTGSRTDADASSSPLGSDAGDGQDRVDDDDYVRTFRRAADLILDALALDDGGGGVVFLDTVAAAQAHRLPFPHTDSTNSEGSSGQDSDGNGHGGRRHHLRKPKTPTSPTATLPTDVHVSSSRPAATLACAQHAPPPALAPAPGQEHFVAPSSADLAALIKRHPRGKLFTFGRGGQLVSSSDEQPLTDKVRDASEKKKTTGPRSEAMFAKKCFPTARQLIFLPLWNSTTSRWVCMFAYNCSDYRNFSNTPDFLYCVAFNNCIATEVSQLATVIADQQKSDFIGSISHELRSPLHGILASCEFLGDTECTSFQRSLIDTADSCARTLLDTINMVLDYSKINTFERNITRAKKSKRDIHGSKVPMGIQSHLSIYADVDLAAITEEVVEGVATGHVFRDSLQGADVFDSPDNHVRSSTSRSLSSYPRTSHVEIIVDIASRDWTYWSQPGALRRIVMNLFGNSLKYTKHGFIHVKLEAQDVKRMPGSGVNTHVTLTVDDSGQGISPEYMRTKLFTPFAQESSLTPGTGLGLSLVKSIVDMLDGQIEIESTVGVGTKVTVKLPMTKGHTKSGSASTPSSAGSSIERVKDNSIDLVKSQAHVRRIAVYRTQDTGNPREGSTLMHHCIMSYLQDWYGFDASLWDAASTWDTVVVEEHDLHQLLVEAPQLSRLESRTMVLVLCHTASPGPFTADAVQSQNFEEIRYPFGPFKLARGLRVCFERSQLLPASFNRDTARQQLHDGKPSPVMEEIISAIENVTITSDDPETMDIAVVRAGGYVALEDSLNAQMTLNNVGSLQVVDNKPSHEEDPEFPFFNGPEAQADGTVSPTTRANHLQIPRPPMAPARRTISPTRQELISVQQQLVETNPTSSRGALTNLPATSPIPLTRSPRMLLVDDNRINLKLLQTFMRKRKYINVTSAEDGLDALNAYTSLLKQSTPPDIILMDISMPIMNGFEATRKIREVENEHREQLPPLETPPSCLIIALTGLASARDQSEAFTSGFDLYITKPVSFAEVSRLLDNWEANGGAGAADYVPHGAAVPEKHQQVDVVTDVPIQKSAVSVTVP